MIKKLSPKNDFVFQILFGTEENKDLLIALLNAILQLPQDKMLMAYSGLPVTRRFAEYISASTCGWICGTISEKLLSWPVITEALSRNRNMRHTHLLPKLTSIMIPASILYVTYQP